MEKLRGDEPEYSEDSKAASSSSNKKSVKSVPRDTSRKGRTSAGGGGGGGGSGSGSSTHLANSAIGGGRDNADIVGKMEGDIKKLKVDLQLSRNKENDLRDQIVSYMTGKNIEKFTDEFSAVEFSGGTPGTQNNSVRVSGTRIVLWRNEG